MILQPQASSQLRFISSIVETIEIFIIFIVCNNAIDNILITIFFQFSYFYRIFKQTFWTMGKWQSSPSLAPLTIKFTNGINQLYSIYHQCAIKY